MQQPQIDISKTTPIKCDNEECGSEFFEEVTVLRKASRLLTGEMQDRVVPIQTFRCADCGNVNKEFQPKF